MNKEEKLNNLYQNKTILKENVKRKELEIRYLSRVISMCFYIIFMSINIYIFNINTIPSIILGALFSFLPTIPIRYNLNKIVRNKYKMKIDKLNILIHLLENNTDINNKKDIKKNYEYKYNPNISSQTIDHNCKINYSHQPTKKLTKNKNTL